MLLQKGWDGGVEVCATECVICECNEGGLETNCGRIRMRDKGKGPGDTKSHERLGIEHDFLEAMQRTLCARGCRVHSLSVSQELSCAVCHHVGCGAWGNWALGCTRFSKRE
jgi:hypothetical protein